MARSPKHNDDDGELMERDVVTPTDSIEPFAASPLTVTVGNPTPPTNVACVSYGTLPSPPDQTQATAQAGAAGPITAIATPIAPVSAVSIPAEATGTVVVDTKPGQTSITVMGNFTANPNSSHASNQAPGTLPTITGLAPAAPVSGPGVLDLTVTGTGFEPASVINVAGVPYPTTYISPTSLKAYNVTKKATAGTLAITVVTFGTATAPTNWTFT
jgi:hypothetical protein